MMAVILNQKPSQFFVLLLNENLELGEFLILVQVGFYILCMIFTHFNLVMVLGIRKVDRRLRFFS